MRLMTKMCVLFLFFTTRVFAQDAPVQKIAVLPFVSMGLDQPSVKTAENMLRLEIGRQSTMDIVSEKRILDILGKQVCAEHECAIEIGKKLNADKVVMSMLSPLGEKIVVQYSLIEVNESVPVLQDQIVSSTIEDLDVVMKRIAKSIVTGKHIEAIAEVGNVTQEEAKDSRRRGSRNISGLTFGYLYPQNGYDDIDRSFTMDFRTGAEFENYDVGMQISLRKGFGVNLFSSYLFSKKDFCPFLGGGFGFHWVMHKNQYVYYDYDEGDYKDSEKLKKDGFELSLNTGVRLYHTYNFEILFNLGYCYTFNDYDDRAIYFTFGMVR